MKNSLKSFSAVCAIVASGTFAGAALAQENSSPADESASQADGGEIIVTAQKRAQSLRDVPLSITALGGDSLKAIGHADVTAMVNLVPGLQVQQFSPTTVVFNIRGVSQNNFADSQEAPIAFYNDEVYTAALSAISGQNYDLERVEVLKGPQGTLFGRNATGGLVQYITAKPTKDLQSAATLTVGSNNQIGTDAFVSGPLSEQIRARVSVSSDKYDAYIKNLAGPDIGNRNFFAARAQIEADIGSGGLLRIKGQYLQNIKENSAPYSLGASTVDPVLGTGVPNPGGCDANGYCGEGKGPFVQAENTVPVFRRKFWSITGRYEQDLGGNIQLTSISDYQQVKKSYGEDTDMGPTANSFVYGQSQSQWQASQELRLSGKSDKLSWVTGVYGLHVRGDAAQSILSNYAFLFPPASTLDYTFQEGQSIQTTKSVAVFGQVDYKALSNLTLTVGGRYSYDLKRNNYTHTLDTSVDATFNPGNNPLARQVYKNWSGKVGLEYRPFNDVLLYSSINRGTKSGGFDIPMLLYDFADMPYKQEVLTNVEAGFKVSALDRKIDLSGAVFHYNYSNYQAFILVGATTAIKNLPARQTGFELEAAIRPISGLQMNVFLNHLSSVVRNVVVPSGAIVDRKLPNAPSWSVGWNVSYSVPVFTGKATIATNWRYDSSFYQTTFNDETALEDGHIVGNVQLRYDTDHWSAGLFINNVTDKKYRVYVIDNSGLQGTYNSTFAQPRWVGGTLTLRY